MPTYVHYDKDHNITASATWQAPDMVEVPFNVVRGYDGKLYPEDEVPEKPQELIAKETHQQELSELESWMTANDYKQFKYLRGEYTDEEWTAIKTEFQTKAARISELRELIGD